MVSELYEDINSQRRYSYTTGFRIFVYPNPRTVGTSVRGPPPRSFACSPSSRGESSEVTKAGAPAKKEAALCDERENLLDPFLSSAGGDNCGKMRHGNYADPGINSMMAAQMHHMAAQRLQHNPGVNQFPGREESLRAEEERHYMPVKAEGHWQWDREGSKASNALSSHVYDEGQGSEAPRSLYQGQRSDSKLVLEKQGNKDLEIGYEDNSLPLTFEGLEQKFLQEFLKLAKEQQDAEDTENARHRERLSEINTQYQEKLLAMRARQATQREDFLRKESLARHQQYQQAWVMDTSLVVHILVVGGAILGGTFHSVYIQSRTWTHCTCAGWMDAHR
ncbi:hypothetical protein J5N97_027481 [Dioscorea zingiberensis]|uniref:Uncharacterized protein n=1 Tax=Dioscorea zingiberensis TaxID=325984 RepID=A0A9D5C4X3_9LILI|nr:hypothetical protein J5N97_027481 [Dioscorea zingiberensis]